MRNQKERSKELFEEKLIFKELKSNPYHRLNTAFALMSILPLLIFLYILVSKLFTINVLAGVIGLLFALALYIAICGYLLTHDIFVKMISYAARLRARETNKSKFIAIVSHELLDPITGIMGNIENMTGGIYGDLTCEQENTLNLCLNMANRMKKLANSLTDMHKIEAGITELSRKPCNLLHLVENQLKEMQILFKAKKISHHIRAIGGNFSLYADEDKLSQVVHNLLSNSIKYSNEGGAIEISIAKNDSVLRLEIRNNGPLIPRDDLENIFDKYIRLYTAEEGLGLGLAIIKDIVALHKGHIWAESSPREGNKFIVELPSDLREA